MKQLFWVLLILCLLAACNNGDTSSEQQSSGEEPQSENKANHDDHSEDGSNTTSLEQDKEEVEEKEERKEESSNELNDEPLYKITSDASVVPIKEGTNEDVVLLTIDDAPDKYALEMAKTLKSLDAGAIFFVNGHFIDTKEEKEILKEIHEMGFLIGNHTYNHTNLKDIEEDQDKQRDEITQLNDEIEEIIGERPAFFRAPHGVNTDYSTKVAQEEKMIVMNWTYGYDYFEPYKDVDKLTEAMVSGKGPEVDVPYSLLKSGANLLMHDREWTNEALEEIVLGLREEGYEIVDPHTIKKDK
ncbi:Peptidoglycan/xylan/chitin deacetylase, PgdA/CDA1 family [Oceanobacillus limi]|uniref:Peptidoglycan/xylan/chitin deacetylase, PgdA/CDA1 family n=1 Tax=Oceanobacillus limi TaxID=930131 RepID=A0A1I0DBE3_9BACI|nr:polysaccharide deacetylase family protein [Oceanobacillus limi]SET29260.1 Peptidoglycan/xylan/chitin deacetylase, PgdA/CDA1 family [Oceanobacillus limi]